MRLLPLTAFAAIAASASADVVSQGDSAFHVTHSVQLVIPPDEAYAILSNPSRWWSPEHSYSGDSANFSMSLKPGGCFCERLPDNGGFVEHMRVAQVMPGEKIVMTGGLGPLISEPATGTMVWSVERVAGGAKVTIDYKVFGYPGTASRMAGPVDFVIGEQITRLRRASLGTRRDIP